MWARLQRFRALDSARRGLFFRAFAAMPLICLSLAMRGFGSTRATLRRFIPRENPERQPLECMNREAISRTAQMVRAAARFGFGHFACLEKSLTLWWLLCRQGIASTVRIGARMIDGKFEAHAWVECGGVAVHEQEETDRFYAAFDNAFPSQSPHLG